MANQNAWLEWFWANNGKPEAEKKPFAPVSTTWQLHSDDGL